MGDSENLCMLSGPWHQKKVCLLQGWLSRRDREIYGSTHWGGGMGLHIGGFMGLHIGRVMGLHIGRFMVLHIGRFMGVHIGRFMGVY